MVHHQVLHILTEKNVWTKQGIEMFFSESIKKALNPQKGVSIVLNKCIYTQPFGKLLEKWIRQCRLGRIRQVTSGVSPIITSWRRDSSNISLVVLDKLLLYYSQNLSFWKIKKSKTDRLTAFMYEVSSPGIKKYLFYGFFGMISLTDILPNK